MNIGFTGTRKGMTFNQRYLLETLLKKLIPPLNDPKHDFYQFLHGNCRGADEQAKKIAHNQDY